MARIKLAISQLMTLQDK